MRVLIIGSTGFVGSGLERACRLRGHEVVGVARATTAHRCDLTDRRSVVDVVASVAPDVVINAAYSRGTDMAEVTGTGAVNVAAASAAHGVQLIHMSTDVVFESSPSWRDESDPTEPSSDYGAVKLRAETGVLDAAGAAIVRTSLVYGDADHPGHQEALVERAVASRGSVVFYDDEVRAPIHVNDLARGILDLAESSAVGVWHVAGPEAVDRLTLASAIAVGLGHDGELVGRPGPADPQRPRSVLLSSDRFAARFGWRPRPIAEVLADRWSLG